LPEPGTLTSAGWVTKEPAPAAGAVCRFTVVAVSWSEVQTTKLSVAPDGRPTVRSLTYARVLLSTSRAGMVDRN
jgi:hypothetical protein